MSKELIIKKCEKCGALIEVIESCNCEECGISCCGNKMQTIIAKTEDKSGLHIPMYKKIEEQIIISFLHSQQESHRIMWVAFVNEEKIGKKFFPISTIPEVYFPYVKGAYLYAYCNQDGLYKVVVE